MAPLAPDGKPEDATEFLQFLLQALHEEVINAEAGSRHPLRNIIVIVPQAQSALQGGVSTLAALMEALCRWHLCTLLRIFDMLERSTTASGSLNCCQVSFQNELQCRFCGYKMKSSDIERP